MFLELKKLGFSFRVSSKL